MESALLARKGYAILYWSALVLLTIVMVAVGFRITATTNLEVNPYDQNAYIFLARQMEGAWYPWYTDGTRNPLFPWMAAQLLDANHPDFFLAGNVIYIDHGEGIVTAYFHLSKTLVAKGDIVERGQEIGLVGSSGRVTGPHLHWSARYGAVTVNPLDLITITRP